MSEGRSESPAPPPNGGALAKLNTPGFLWPATVALAGLLFLGLDYFLDFLTHESTDDAFIAAHVVSVAPRVAGQVIAVRVLDNQMVQSNDLLVELDPEPYAVALAQKTAAQRAEDSNAQAARAAYEMMKVKVATAEATARESQADADAAAAAAAKARADFIRAKSLRADNTISAQEFDQFKAAADAAQANLIAAQQKAASDQSKIAEARAQLEAARAEADAVLSQVNQFNKEVDAAQLDLSYTKIFAPCAGRVTRKQVEPGDYVEVGQQLLSLVPTDVWVVANFKESQLKHMQPGQPATVAIDALGGRKFRAHVDSIQAGSGAAFSLLPPENATGNFVKVVQRVPVKILFNEPLPADKPLGPGLSVEPSVRVSGFEVPVWAVALAAVALAGAAKYIFQFIARRRTRPVAE